MGNFFYYVTNTVKSVFRGHDWDEEKVAS